MTSMCCSMKSPGLYHATGIIITSISQIWKLRHAEEGMTKQVGLGQAGSLHRCYYVSHSPGEMNRNRWRRERGETQGNSGQGNGARSEKQVKQN